MEKIKITREQEGEFKEYLRLECSTSDIESYINDYGPVLQNHYPNLYKVKPEQFALLLCGWYEVEQPFKVFKVGDWVKHINSECYTKLENEHFDNAWGLYEKVTETWKVVLLELGREKPELKVGDVYVFESGVPVYVSTPSKHNINIGKAKYLHPIESRIELKEEKK